MNQPLPPIPKRIARLPMDHRGFPIPWFVAELPDGTRDFRIADQGKKIRALNAGLCWVCGDRLGVYRTFPIGPMCAVNRVTSEPPCHDECAIFSVQACPFLIRPRMRRNDNDLPEGHENAGGVMIMRNPGVTCLWQTPEYRPFDPDTGMTPRRGKNFLIRLGHPSRVRWYSQGREATRDEVRASIDSGMPLLMDMAVKQGSDAIAELERLRLDVDKMIERIAA